MRGAGTFARFRRRAAREVLFVVLVVWAIIELAPIAFVIVNALKSDAEYVKDPLGLPIAFRIGNFAEALTGGPLGLPIGRYLLNSAIVTSGAVMLTLLFGAMAAFAISRLRYRGARLISGFSFFMLAIPLQITLIPIFVFMGQLGLRNNLLGLVAVYTAFWLPLSILILRGFYDSFLSDIEEAARIDGCGDLGVFWRIVLPLSISPMIGVALVVAIGVWNELLFVLVLTSRDEVRTLTAGLKQFQTAYLTSWHLLFAGLAISILPQLILYLALQRRIQAGLASGTIR